MSGMIPLRDPRQGPASVPCPYCGAPVGEVCMSVRDGVSRLDYWHSSRDRAYAARWLDERCAAPHPIKPSPACQRCREHGHVDTTPATGR